MSESNKPAAKPKPHSAQRWNIVWVVPILAVLIGGWMLYESVSNKGPSVRIRFETADGIVAGKTEIRCRSVTVGRVMEVELAEDLNSVLVYCELNEDTNSLLRSGTRFWVVRPRVSSVDVSGLGTLLTGAYIELEPGTGREGPRKFKGREIPPATNRNVPGLRLTLVTEEACPLSPGAPIYHRGFKVGSIESRDFDKANNRILFETFIEEEYQDLVKTGSRFWNTNGINISSSIDGFKVTAPSIHAIVSGGVSFASVEGVDPGDVAEDGMIFNLFEDDLSANATSFDPTMKALLLFDQSVRGLSKSATVEFRGITIGRVVDVSFQYTPKSDSQMVPVLIEMDPRVLKLSPGQIESEDELQRLEEAIKNGLRATLKTGSLLTGSLYVDLDYYEDASDVYGKMSYQDEFPVIPTISSGFAQVEVRLASILEKIDNLPFEQTVKQVNELTETTKVTMEEAKTALKQIEHAATAATQTMNSPKFKELLQSTTTALAEVEKTVMSMGPNGAVQGDFLRTLDEFRASLRSMEVLTNSIEEDPSSLIFGKGTSKNPKPRAAGSR